ncbi:MULTISPECIES: diacylglycerol kinase [Streptomyces]|uniref:Diacylglycerol kinase n=1 Tax=Streptomyces poriferorum TaxID=2798799 RepID=A0ABY9IRP9_9ACTN|nr:MULTISPECIES: diacylglycerol kinase [Streptomyces]MBW5253724.1 diacylglycerol kinase [Streptomyces poriferorum]MBW5258477.1 diacylglycerol kinase [Streptomyces poriferorum]MDP5313006.1 diacylglycerol kinase [Streptomyces sp. Alt4]WLQ57992.1 diacylglycerol kinase [Streptomyces sp. Alt2]WSI64145.1 diacylglycerol kinase [Streptomyces sp. NBC_01336]
MSAAQPPGNGAPHLLVVIDPVARRTDGESVRIAKDVLSAGSHAKICLPDGPEEFARALARRGARRPVVIGDDRALRRAVALLHREREPAMSALALIPVGAAAALELAHSLGVPMGAVAAARTALDGAVRRLDLLVDDSDGVVLDALRIPALTGAPGTQPDRTGVTAVWDTCRSLVRTLVRPAPSAPAGPPATHRLRVEADGIVLNDLGRPVESVTLTSGCGDGMAEVTIHAPGGDPMTTEAKAVTVSGADFRYRADIQVAGPVRTRTWTVRAGAWGLMLPVAEG